MGRWVVMWVEKGGFDMLIGRYIGGRVAGFGLMEVGR